MREGARLTWGNWWGLGCGTGILPVELCPHTGWKPVPPPHSPQEPRGSLRPTGIGSRAHFAECTMSRRRQVRRVLEVITLLAMVGGTAWAVDCWWFRAELARARRE